MNECMSGSLLMTLIMDASPGWRGELPWPGAWIPWAAVGAGSLVQFRLARSRPSGTAIRLTRRYRCRAEPAPHSDDEDRGGPSLGKGPPQGWGRAGGGCASPLPAWCLVTTDTEPETERERRQSRVMGVCVRLPAGGPSLPQTQCP